MLSSLESGSRPRRRAGGARRRHGGPAARVAFVAVWLAVRAPAGPDGADSPRTLVGDAFAKVRSELARPTAALVVDALVTPVGIDGVRENFLDVTPATWAAACAKAGTSREAVEKAWRRR